WGRPVMLRDCPAAGDGPPASPPTPGQTLPGRNHEARSIGPSTRPSGIRANPSHASAAQRSVVATRPGIISTDESPFSRRSPDAAGSACARPVPRRPRPSARSACLAGGAG
ncbi:MAG: hypothetical protein AVDCRST_MAG59-706, partial [uncultured Thermomicrobiales bacterium]